MGGQTMARNLRGQEPGRGHRHATAAGTLIIADSCAPRHFGEDMVERLRFAFLRRAYGLTEAQALALVSLVWGAGS